MAELAINTQSQVISTRKVSFEGKTIDMSPVSTLSSLYDKINWEEDTMHISVNRAVLGNAAGREQVEGDKTNAITAILGRKYNNGRITIPFPMSFVRTVEGKITEIYDAIQKSTIGSCLDLQKELNGDQLAAGHELSIRSEAIRAAKKELSNAGSVVNEDMLRSAIDEVKGIAPAKLFFESSLSISGRTKANKEERQLGMWKSKVITSADGRSTSRHVAFANASGLKRVPIFNGTIRSKAELMVIDFAEMAVKEISTIVSKAYDPNAALKVLESIARKMPTYGDVDIENNRFTEEDLARIESMKRSIITRVREI